MNCTKHVKSRAFAYFLSLPEALRHTSDSHFSRKNTCKTQMRKNRPSDIRVANFIQITYFYESKGRLCQRCLECSGRPARQKVLKTLDFSHIAAKMCQTHETFRTLPPKCAKNTRLFTHTSAKMCEKY